MARLLATLLLVVPVCCASRLRAKLEELEAEKSACSACNMVSKMLDTESLSSQLIKAWKDSSSKQRSKLLKKSLKKACSKLADMEIAAVSGVGGSRTFFDRLEMKKLNTGDGHDTFKDAKMGPAVTGVVVELCELLVTEQTNAFLTRMEGWMNGKKGRRLVDFRFDTDLEMCAGGVLSVCTSPSGSRSKPTQAAKDDEDDEDDREL